MTMRLRDRMMGGTSLRYSGALMAPDEGAGAGAGGSSPPPPPPASPPPPPAAAGAGDANGVRAEPAFAETLPEKIRGDAAFRDIKNLDALATGYLNAQKLIGKIGADPNSVVALPTGDDTDAWNGLYQKLGRPEKSEGYVLKAPEGRPYSDGDKAFQSAILPVLHEAGLTQRQLDKIMPAWNELQARATGTLEASKTAKVGEATAALKTEWGQAYDERVKLAEDAIPHFGGEEFRDFLVESGLNNDPRLIKALAKFGAGLKEDGVLGRGDGGGGSHSPAEAQQQINALYADAAFGKVYGDKKAPGHAEAVARMQALFQQAHPDA
jgi:hypothetical protein